MGLFLRQTEERSELQNRVAAELTDRLKDKPPITQQEVEPQFLENQHQTRWAGIIIGVLVFIALIWTIVALATNHY